MSKLKRWEYAIIIEQPDRVFSLWPQEQASDESPVGPAMTFDNDRQMLGYMSSEGWELVTSISLHDAYPRLIFKRRLK